jgi:hypothetical protein
MYNVCSVNRHLTQTGDGSTLRLDTQIATLVTLGMQPSARMARRAPPTALWMEWTTPALMASQPLTMPSNSAL